MFGHNEVARTLSESLGYRAVAIRISKRVCVTGRASERDSDERARERFLGDRRTASGQRHVLRDCLYGFDDAQAEAPPQIVDDFLYGIPGLQQLLGTTYGREFGLHGVMFRPTGRKR